MMASIATSQPEMRSAFRMNFINALPENAYRLLEIVYKYSSWEEACSDSPDAMAQHWLIDRCQTSAASLIEALNQRRKETGNNLETENKALVLLVFDEAANLWIESSKEKNGAPYFAIRRVLGMLQNNPIWGFLLSTQSSTESLLRSRDLESSSRVNAGLLKFLEPFLALQLDVADIEEVRKNSDAVRKTPMKDFATADHMTLFGRPLW